MMGYRETIDAIVYALDAFKVTRRISLAFAMWLTYYGVTESVHFAYVSKLDGLGIGAVIASITAPISMFMSFVSKFYFDGYKGDKDGLA